MKPNSNLFQLIHSMSKKEKRNFRASNHGHSMKPSNYIILFDEIARSTSYDEEKLKINIKKKAEIREFSVTKHLLYKQVLKSLRNFRENVFVDNVIEKLFHEIGILFNRKLQAQSYKVLHQAKELASKYEKTCYIYEALIWENRLTCQSNVIFPIHAYSWEESTHYKVFQLFREELLYTNIYWKTKWLNQPYVFSGLPVVDIPYAKNLLNHPLLKEQVVPKTFLGKSIYAELKAVRLFIEGQYHKASEISHNNYQVWISDPPKIEGHFLHFLELSINTAICSLFSEKYYLFFLIKEELSKISLKFLKTRITQEKVIQKLDDLHDLYTNQTGKLNGNLNRLFTQISCDSSQWKLIFTFQTVLFFIRTQQYRKAQKWIAHFSDNFSRKVPLILSIYWRILEIIIFYELNLIDLLEYKLVSLCRLLKKENHIDCVFYSMANTIQKIIDCNQETVKSQEFENLLDKHDEFQGKIYPQTLKTLADWIRKQINLT